MTRKKLILYFVFMYVVLALTAIGLEVLTGQTGCLLDVQAMPQAAYAFSLLCGLTAIVAAFCAIRQRKWNPIIRLSILNSAALLTLLDYYLFYDANMLACLPILGAASLFVLLKKEV